MERLLKSCKPFIHLTHLTPQSNSEPVEKWDGGAKVILGHPYILMCALGRAFEQEKIDTACRVFEET